MRQAVVFLSLLAGCSGLHTAIPPDVARDTQVIAVTDRGSFSGTWADESFNVGSFRAADVDRSGTRSSGWSAGPLSKTTAKNGYTYKWKGGPAGEAQGACAAEDVAREVDLAVVAEKRGGSTLSCRCAGAGLDARIDLDGNGADWHGNASAHGTGYTAASLTQYENGFGSGQPLGFVLRASAAVGAVDVMRPGRVWLAPALDATTRAEVACLLAGLLLYQAPAQK